MRRLIVFLAVSFPLLTGSFLLGCGVPVDESVTVIDQQELPENLRRETTTTSTTIPTAVREVDYFLLVQPPDVAQRKVEPVTRSVEESDSLTTLLAPMFTDDFVRADATGDGPELINRVIEYSFVQVRRDTEDREVAIVELETFDDRAPNNETLRDVAAQLVFTLTEFEEVTSITIEIDGERQSLPTTNAEGGNTDEPVTTEDYELYDPEFVAPPSTSTTTEPN